MNTKLAEVVNKVDEYTNRLEQIQNNQIQIANLGNERIDKMVSIGDKVLQVGDLYLESKRLDNEQVRLKNELATILSEHQKDMVYINQVFAERGVALSKFFAVIDKGLESGNDSLVLMGLAAANGLVKSDPMKSINELRGKLDSNETLESDF